MNSFYSQEELKKIGFKSLGQNILISRKASVYGAKNISIGNNVRIDDFCILSGKITLGNHIHISAYSSIFAGNAGVEFKDFVTFSSRCVVYAVSDDYSGKYMTNPMLPDKYINVIEKKVVLNKHCIVGTNSTILPGVELAEGVSIGAMSLVNKSLPAWGIYVGIPVKKIKERSKQLLELEKEFLEIGENIEQ